MVALVLVATASCLLAAVCHASASGPASNWIEPGLYPTTPHWNDTDGERIEAHAAGMLQSSTDHRWYWYGESKKDGDLRDHGVNCYSAPGLSGPWRNEGQVFHQSDVHVHDSTGPFIIERPKVLYNKATSLYVMWFHLDTAGYKYRHVGVATSSEPNRGFVFHAGFKPDGVNSLDMSLFLDPLDGQAYHIRSCDNEYVGISRLTPDYLNTTGIISNHSVFEGMALFRHSNGTYYIITSHLTGWSPNPLMMFRAQGKTLDDPQWVPATGCGANPTCDKTSYNTQPTYVVSVTPTTGEPYFLYMADNWVHGGPRGLVDASYVWLPIKFNDDNITIPKYWKWNFDDPWGPIPPAPPPPPPPLVPGSCVAAVPARGGAIALAVCGAPNVSSGQAWMVQPQVSEMLQLRTGKLCVDKVTSTPGTLALGECDKLDTPLQFTFDPASGRLIEKESKMCMDITYCGTQVCPAAKVGLYSCNSAHQNQEFALDKSSGHLVAKINGQCLTGCGAPH